MDEKDFQDAAEKADDATKIDDLCLRWLTQSANDHAPKVRMMMLLSIDVIRKGLE